MNRLALIIASALWLAYTSHAMALELPVVSEHLTIKEGLSNNFVTDIVQDKQGFLWIGTDEGLNRFDGENFTIYSQKNSPIAGNAIQCLLYEDKRDRLWIGTKKGLSVFDCASQRFETIELPDKVNVNNVVDLMLSENGEIWIVNHYDNIILYNAETGACRVYNPANTKGLPGSFRSIAEHGSSLYIGHADEGLSVMDKNTGKIRSYRYDAGNPDSLPGNDVFCIHIDHYGKVWVGTGQGLAIFDQMSDRFIRFRHDSSNPNSPIGNHIYKIIETKDSNLWIASDMGGVSILDLRALTFRNTEQLQFLNLETAYGNDTSLSSPNARTVFQDSYGNIWIGNYSTGLDFVSHTRPAFTIRTYTISGHEAPDAKSRPVWSVYKDQAGVLWLGGINNVTSVKDGKVLRKYDLSGFISSAYSHVTAIRKYQDRLILGIYDGGALSLDTRTGTVTRITPVAVSHVNSLYDTDGKLLIGAKDGLYIFDGEKCSKLSPVSQNFFNLTPNGIVTDNQGKLWIGSYGLGVYVFDRNKKLRHHLESDSGFISNAIIQIFKDSKGGIWIAGQDGLAYVKDSSRPDEYINYGYREGLDDVYIRAIQEDRNGDIWLALNSSLARLNRKTGRFDNYDFNDGLPQSNFIDRAVTIMPDGSICFGSFNGICVFNPDDLSVNDKVKPVQIVEFQNIGSRTANKTDGIILPGPDGAIELPYNHNSIRVMFAVPDFSQSRLVEYAYMIEGIDKDWTPTKGEPHATFRNLPPGSYTFKVRARLKNQDWDDASIAMMKITVKPPLWLTWWAKIIYLLIAAAAIYLVIRHYKRRLMLKNSLELERRKSIDEKALNDERLRFYTNITHELRTPLTLIVGPLEDLVSDNKMPGTYKDKIKIIHDSAIRLLNLINQILEFRKTETQNRRLTVGKGNIGNLVTEIGLRYKELNRNHKVQFDINVQHISEEVYFDNDVMTTILNNLLSNAVKYTPTGKITLSLAEVRDDASDYIEISVADTGYGIEAESLPHIFDRYYQAKGRHQASGTGIGLALVKSLSDLHDADLSVESCPGVGTTFRLRLLKDNTYPSALHKEFDVNQNAGYPASLQDDTTDNGDSTSVLVVEDNEAIRDYIAGSLKDRFRVLTALNGKEGLELARKDMPDIIISDIMMPEMDGIELCRHIKQNVSTSHIPVILLTAKDSIQDKEEGYESGADSYLTKPFSAKLLISRIDNILESRKRLASLVSSGIAAKTYVAAAAAKPDSNEAATPLTLGKLDQEFLNRLTSLIEDNISNEALDMAFIQDALNMSHSTIYRKVKGLTGLSANEFIRKVRLRHGHGFLCDGYNVTEAAYSCGFGDVKHFRNCFKDEYGVTPSQFIKELKLRRTEMPYD